MLTQNKHDDEAFIETILKENHVRYDEEHSVFYSISEGRRRTYSSDKLARLLNIVFRLGMLRKEENV